MNEELLRYIKPGEFTFCSRCGLICRKTDKAFMCTQCKHFIFSRKKITKLEEQEILAEQLFEQQISDICKVHRENLAILRKDVE